MAGYIGTKAVNLSTTGADIAGDANIDGTITSDGLTVDGNVTVNGSLPNLYITETDTTDLNTRFALQSGVQYLASVNDALSVTKNRISWDNSTGDISFYEDTGTTAKFFWDASAESLGIGKTDRTNVSVLTVQNVSDVSTNTAEFYNDNGNRTFRFAQDTSGNADLLLEKDDGTDTVLISTHGDSYFNGGNLLVGKSSSSSTTAGAEIFGSGYQFLTNDGVSLYLTRPSTDGEMLRFLKGTASVGSISTYSGDLVIGTGDTGLFFNDASDHIKPVNSSNGANRDNAIDLGSAGSRWAVVRAGTGSINTSDRNEKQDIEELSDAEQRVAVACKSLIRKFKFNDAVEAKGIDARIHVGIIAQDLQAAFASEGLDASRYAMFCSDTWWETQTEVPAVEAVAEITETTTDKDGNEVVTVVTEAVEAKDAYTRTDTYETQEEAPEGATERTRLGVRYSELLAFIIGAL